MPERLSPDALRPASDFVAAIQQAPPKPLLSVYADRDGYVVEFSEGSTEQQRADAITKALKTFAFARGLADG